MMVMRSLGPPSIPVLVIIVFYRNGDKSVLLPSGVLLSFLEVALEPVDTPLLVLVS